MHSVSAARSLISCKYSEDISECLHTDRKPTESKKDILDSDSIFPYLLIESSAKRVQTVIQKRKGICRKAS